MPKRPAQHTGNSQPTMSDKQFSRLEKVLSKGKAHFALFYGPIYGIISGSLFVLSNYLFSNHLTLTSTLINLTIWTLMGILAALVMWHTVRSNYNSEKARRWLRDNPANVEK